MKLTFAQKEIHERALVVGKKYQIAEAEMIQILQEVEAAQIQKSLGLSSLLKYAIQYLKLSEPIALAFIAVARKCKTVPALKAAIQEGKISASTANRLASTITKENASELISYAANHTWRETEREVANRNPRAAHPDKVKMLGNGLVQLTITISEEGYANFQRACSIEAQRKSKSPSRGEVFVSAVEAHLEKHDPVRRAERAKQRSERTDRKSKDCSEPAKPSQKHPERTRRSRRIRLTAANNHAVNLRDQGRCTHIDEHGKRCNSDRWTETHHIISVADGGTNDLSNLTTLCSFHHDLVHQLSLPMDGQITWLRSPASLYATEAPPEWRSPRIGRALGFSSCQL
jgi:HNH endonuclease